MKILLVIVPLVGLALFLGIIADFNNSRAADALQRAEIAEATTAHYQRQLNLSIEFGFDPLIVKTTEEFAQRTFATPTTDPLVWRFVQSPDELSYVLLSIIKVESDGAAGAVGDSGRSFGLTQMQLPTARAYNKQVVPADLLNIETHLDLAFKHFLHLMCQYRGNWALAVLAWNRGETRVNSLIRMGNLPENGYAQKVIEASMGENAR